MLHCSSVNEVAQYLRLHTPYSAMIEESGVSTFTARFLEELVSKHRFSTFVTLCRYEMAIGNAFYRYFIMRDEIDQIERATLMLLGGNKDIYLQRVNSFLDKYLSIDLFALGRANSLPEIAQSLSGTAYDKLYRRCTAAPRVDYFTFEQAFESYFAGEVRNLCEQCFSGSEKKALLELLCQAQDCRLIQRIWRTKRFYADAPDLCADLTGSAHPLTLFNERQLKALASCQNEAAVFQVLETTPYCGWINAKNKKNAEFQLDFMLFSICKKEIRFSSYPSVVMFCYLQLSAIETKNLLRVIEGVKFQVPAQVIEDNLIQYLSYMPNGSDVDWPLKK